MIVRSLSEIEGTDRDVVGDKGTWRSKRLLLKRDGVGFSLHETTVYAGTSTDIWYANHVEAVFCTHGKIELVDRDEDTSHIIIPGTLYVLDDADKHTLRAVEDSRFVCVFVPPIVGDEDHDEHGVYPLKEE